MPAPTRPARGNQGTVAAPPLTQDPTKPADDNAGHQVEGHQVEGHQVGQVPGGHGTMTDAPPPKHVSHTLSVRFDDMGGAYVSCQPDIMLTPKAQNAMAALVASLRAIVYSSYMPQA